MTSKKAFIFGLLVGLLVALLVTYSPASTNKGYLITEMEYAKEIHEAYLKLPESDATGNWVWHARWVATYEAVIIELEEVSQ